jgi:hypothetical protein
MSAADAVPVARARIEPARTTIFIAQSPSGNAQPALEDSKLSLFHAPRCSREVTLKDEFMHAAFKIP